MENVVSDSNVGETVKVLALDGGGVRGLFTISFLAVMEHNLAKETGNPQLNIADYFDLITGTSIGGILALGLASGRNARELQETFHHHAPKIFKNTGSLKRFCKRFWGPLHKTGPLEAAICGMIDVDSKFQDLNKRVMIPAINLTTGRPQFFKTPHNPEFTRDADKKLIDAALATSAAPTYFKPHFVQDLNAYFADGGLIANSPAFIGLHEVLRDMATDFPNATVKTTKILNVGTAGGEYCISQTLLKKKRNSGYLGLWNGGERIVLTTMAANQFLQDAMLIRELRSAEALDSFVKIDTNIPNEAAPDITLDNASEESLSSLRGRGEQIAHEQYAKNKNLMAFFENPCQPFKKATKELL